MATMPQTEIASTNNVTANSYGNTQAAANVWQASRGYSHPVSLVRVQSIEEQDEAEFVSTSGNRSERPHAGRAIRLGTVDTKGSLSSGCCHASRTQMGTGLPIATRDADE